MRVEGNSAWNAIDTVGLESTESTGRPPSTNTRDSVSGDEANFSAEAQRMTSLQQAVAATPDIREDRVAQLRQSIQQGTYQVSDEQIAGAMLNDLQGFGRRS